VVELEEIMVVLLVGQVVEVQVKVLVFVALLEILDPQHNLVNQVTLEHTVPVMLGVKEEQVVHHSMVLVLAVVEQELQVVKVILKVRVQVELEK
jgi:hypothetical protein|tara:strand:+ start:367 stop:648 length:282 start_codon:yes stop_codon:yes gene_type:complete